MSDMKTKIINAIKHSIQELNVESEIELTPSKGHGVAYQDIKRVCPEVEELRSLQGEDGVRV